MLGVMICVKVVWDYFIKMLVKCVYSRIMIEKNIVFIVWLGGVVNGSICVFGDKFIFYCFIMMGFLVDGIMEVFGFLEGEDSLVIF